MFKPSLKPILSACLVSCMLTSAYALPRASFTPAEHVDIGDQIVLRYSNDSGEVGQPLPLMNGLKLSYGEIISFGDFYGVVDSPISKGSTDANRRNRFLAAFNALAKDKVALEEVPHLLSLIREERNIISAALKEGKSIDQVYAELGVSFDIKFNCITGGGCTEATWLIDLGRYLELANDNFDHFGNDAVLAYQTGHQVALEEAIAAHKTNDKDRLNYAYALNAFASHFLTDRFSAGHIRTPRVELSENTTPQIFGSALAVYMHSEENSFGLHVSNARGDHWIAYGDKSYFKSESETHRKIINETLQASADQIYDAYLTGQIGKQTVVETLIPQPDEIKNQAKLDISTMFYWDETSNTLFRRSKLSKENVFDREWTSDWWGWTTLIELRNERGIETVIQSQLAHSSLKHQALKDGLITEPSLVAYVKQQTK